MDNFRVKSYWATRRKEWKKDSNILDSISDITVKCKCDKSVVIPINREYTICKKCGRKVFNSTKAYFKYKLRKEIKNAKVEQK